MKVEDEVYGGLKIPDLWFDFYARFLPGAGFIAGVYYMADIKIELNTLNVVLFLLGGYLCALITQPISSLIASLIHDCVASRKNKHRLYVRAITKKYDPKRILSKMHGETTFFVQSGLLMFILFVLYYIPFTGFEKDRIHPLIIILISIWLLLCAIIMANRRLKRAIDMEYAALNSEMILKYKLEDNPAK